MRQVTYVFNELYALDRMHLLGVDNLIRSVPRKLRTTRKVGVIILNVRSIKIST